MGSAALLPGLSSCSEGGSAARRLVLVYTPYGGGTEFWPSAGGTVTDSVVLEPLARHRDRLTVIEGLEAASPRFAGSWMSAMTAFTGRDPFGDAGAVAPGDIDGPSLDSAVAEMDGFGGRVLRIATGRATTLQLHSVSFASDGRPYDLVQVAPNEAVDTIAAAFQQDEARVVVWRMATAADSDVAGNAVGPSLIAGDASAARRTLTAARRFFAEQVSGLADRVDATQTLIAWTSGPCPLDAAAPVPFVLIGGGVPHGHLRVPASSRDRCGDLLHSLGRAVVGAPFTRFGDPRFARGPLLEELA
jgi:hypothetical protein